VEIELEHRPPCDAAGALAFLGARAVPGVEQLDRGVYRRSLRLRGGPGVIELRAGVDRITARVTLAVSDDRAAALAAARALLDLDADPQAIDGVLAGDPLLAPLVRTHPGRRVAGHPDPAELAIRAVIGQQVSLAAARTVAARLVVAHGEPLPRRAGAVTHLFPAPRVLAGLRPEELPMPRSRARALIGLARALSDGDLVLDPAGDRAETRRRLLALPGIGPWTADYIEMRALRDRDAFPATDLGLRRALERLGESARPAAIAARAERWRPYRAYALQHLWTTLN
jgi:AraC family transcriptional regulator, regulatory protein of adaptative response / DNA-3-methyladenine glycosylase II